jgi:hypothetical protein
VPVSTAIPAEGSRPHAMIRAPTLRRAVPSRGQARSVQNQAGAADTGVRENLRDLVVSARTAVGCEAGTWGPVGSRPCRRRRRGRTAEVLPPIGGGMRSALLVMAFGGVARERVSAFTPPDLASRADLSASCRPVGAPPCLQARRAGARGRAAGYRDVGICNVERLECLPDQDGNARKRAHVAGGDDEHDVERAYGERSNGLYVGAGRLAS